MSEKKFGPGTQTMVSLQRLGFDEDAKLQKFLGSVAHAAIQKKFDVVFPPPVRPKLGGADSAAAPLLKEGPDELDLGGELSLGGSEEELAMGDDQGLDLGAPGELSLGDDLAPAAEPDEGGLELGDAESMDFSAGGGLDELTGSDTEDMTSLKLGDELNLGDDVLAKLAEIDQIMKEDATNATLIRPAALDESEESSDDLGDALLVSQLDEDTQGDGMLDISDEGPNELQEVSLTNPGELDAPDFAAEDEEAELFATPVAEPPTSKTKKPLPASPILETADEDEVSFGAAEEFQRPAAQKTVASKPRASSEEREDYQQVKGAFNHELERLQATLQHLRADRSELLKKIEELEEHKLSHGRVVLGMRAELDEKKIEVQLLKRRLAEEGQDLKYQLELEGERRKLAEERAKTYQAEAQALQQKVKLEIRKVSSREKELEQKLELLKADAETQIRHRDQKILELKRRNDAMEFDMDALSALEQKNVGDKQELEGKLDKAIKTLRTAIGILESDDPKLATLEKLKKNLDV